jgi:hypothetical protein
MYHTTGFTKAEITELCARIEARELSPRMRRWPPILGLRNALTVTLTYLRRNRVQAEIAENYGVSQPTISRAISAITPLLVQALLDYVPTADELDVGTCYIVDGTLLPCWTWRANPELYSGKHSGFSKAMVIMAASRDRVGDPCQAPGNGAGDLYVHAGRLTRAAQLGREETDAGRRVSGRRAGLGGLPAAGRAAAAAL